MTVPVVGAIRKSGCRYLPEIHASRFSVSGSLRPKLGLLILFVLLILGLVLLVVPLATRLHGGAAAGGQPLIPPPSPVVVPQSLHWTQQLLSHLAASSNSGGGGENVVCSPIGLLASVRVLAGVATGLEASLSEVDWVKTALSPPPLNASCWWLHKLFVQNGPQIKPDFVARVTALGLGVEQVDMNSDSALFQEKLSSWLRAVSGGQLQQQFPLGENSALHQPAQLLLLSAYRVSVPLRGFTRVVASAQQQIFQPFASSGTSARPVVFLARRGQADVAIFDTAGGGSAQAVQLELVDTSRFLLLCILPPAGATEADLTALVERLESDGYLSRDRYQRKEVSVRLPALRQERTVDLVGGGGRDLQNLTGTSLSGLAVGSPALRLTDIRQNIKFELLEDVRRGVSQQEVSEPGAEDLPQLTFDRPFLYSLVHTHSGEIFLAGIVRDPSSP